MDNSVPKVRSYFLLLSISIAIILIAPLIGFISFHGYSFGSAAVSFLFFAAIIIACISGLAEVMGAYIISAVIFSAALTFSIDYIALDFLSSRIHLMILPMLFILMFILSLRMRPNIFIISLVAFSVISVGAIVEGVSKPPQEISEFSGEKLQAASQKRSKIMLHLVLDEHIGLDGIPLDIKGGSEVRKVIESFYERYGFRINSKAYSRYSRTTDSMSNLMNFDSSKKAGKYTSAIEPSGHIGITENKYFDAMNKDGYSIRVYQSDYFRYCDDRTSEVDYCLTYKSNSIKSMEPLALGHWTKSKFILNSFLQESFLYKRSNMMYSNIVRPKLYKLANVRLPEWSANGHRVGPIPAQQLLDSIELDVIASKSKTLIYAHLLTPHYPYVYDKSCQLRASVANWLDRNSTKPIAAENNKITREVRYSRYFEQITCLYSELSEMLQSFEKAGKMDDLTIIMHGDHGSRIGLNDPSDKSVDSLKRNDLVDYYSTLWAVRSEPFKAGVDIVAKPLEQLLLEVVVGRQEDDIDHYFYLRPSLQMDLPRIDGDPFVAMKDKFK